MSEYNATIRWSRNDAKFNDNRYSRVHEWAFDEGLTVRASASPAHVRPPFAAADAVDPEEAFVASLSSCHMLWFLSIAAKKGYVVDSYVDAATGVMEKNGNGRLAMTRVTLKPKVTFSGERVPTAEEIAALHHEAHEECFLANSVKTEIRVE